MGAFAGRVMGSSTTANPIQGTFSWNAQKGVMGLRFDGKSYNVASFRGATLHCDLFRYGGRPHGKTHKFSSSYGSFPQGRTKIKVWKSNGKDSELHYQGDYASLQKSPIAGCKFESIIVIAVGQCIIQEVDENYNTIGEKENLVNGKPVICQMKIHGKWGMEAWNEELVEPFGIKDTRDADGLLITYPGKTKTYQSAQGTHYAPFFQISEIKDDEAGKAFAVKCKGLYDVVQEWLLQHWQSPDVDQLAAKHYEEEVIVQPVKEAIVDDDDLPF